MVLQISASRETELPIPNLGKLVFRKRKLLSFFFFKEVKQSSGCGTQHCFGDQYRDSRAARMRFMSAFTAGETDNANTFFLYFVIEGDCVTLANPSE